MIYWFADKSERWHTWVLILLSLVFYSYWDVRFLPLMLASILLNWCAANVFAETQRHAEATSSPLLSSHAESACGTFFSAITAGSPGKLSYGRRRAA